MESPVRGRIVDWDQTKARGLVDTGDLRLVLYANDIVDRLKTPAVGDELTFQIGEDQRGGTCVRNARYVSAGGRITGGHLLVLIVLLVAPALALARLVSTELILVGAASGTVLSLVTCLVYAADKRRSRAGTPRIKESTLHLCAVLGGWPGAFLAQRWLRHKTSKIRFQVVFWLIVAAHEYVAIDYLIGWQIRDSLLLILRPAA